MSGDLLHQGQPVLRAGSALGEARSAAILIHGRGSSAEDMLGLAQAIAPPGFAILAPQAAGRTWYPQRFLSPLAANEPWLSSALRVVADLVAECGRAQLPPERVVVGGFSQGACLALEFAARHPRRYGAILGLSGGLIGPPGLERRDGGDLAGTPVFIGCSDVDAHIPLASVKASAATMRAWGAEVTEKIYPGMGHTVNEDEVRLVRAMLRGVML